MPLAEWPLGPPLRGMDSWPASVCANLEISHTVHAMPVEHMEPAALPAAPAVAAFEGVGWLPPLTKLGSNSESCVTVLLSEVLSCKADGNKGAGLIRG